MSRTSNRANGDVIRDFLSVAELLEEPQLAQLYAYITREGEATVQELMDALELAQGTAYTYVNRLVDAGVIESTTDEQPRTYAAREIDLTVTAADGARKYTITPALIGTCQHWYCSQPNGEPTNPSRISRYIRTIYAAGPLKTITEKASLRPLSFQPMCGDLRSIATANREK
ncbi:hypothetical protein HALLA_03775 (plasmid) [Halostagnicola larsenii XH-48]|uniref:Transcription regulator TrmB N-terminal domain-containing protein n=1 Tax=Halostagnicola larsenii XH-48 TaxID=797299 RepID=W0JW23_9EURY|nr:hypothetical protein HALLA_03775 [Halostagnicola larsenii XH-48]